MGHTRQDFSADLADLATVHRGRDRFGITTRLAQALAKQAKRQKHTHAHIKSLVAQALKRIDWSNIRVLCIEDLQHVKAAHNLALLGLAGVYGLRSLQSSLFAQ